LTGKVWLVGAGPGDPHLITVRGLELLRAADALVYDRLVSPSLLEYAPARAERHDVGKQRGHHRATQDDISALLIALARAGKQVVRLKGGDPYVFGRGGEEALDLEAAGVAWEVVPGVSSALAAPALAGIPVTQRHVAGSFAVTTGHAGLAKPGLAHADTLVVLMAVEQLQAIVRTLLEQGRDPKTPAALVQAASTPAQRTIRATLGTLLGAAERADMAPPATLVVGQTVALSEQLGWFERRPLFGRRVLLGRTRTEPSELAALLAAAGADVHELPARGVAPLCVSSEREAAAAALRRLAADAYTWVLFGGADSVAGTWTLLDTLGLDSRAIRARVAAFGPGTVEALHQRGVHPDFCPTSYQSGAVAADLHEHMTDAAQLLLPVIEPMPRLVDALCVAGVSVDSVAVGRVEIHALDNSRRLRAVLGPPGPDLVVLAASRAVDELDALLRANRGQLGTARVVCIGPTTADRARALGWRVDDVAEHPTRESLVDAAIKLMSDRVPAGASHV